MKLSIVAYGDPVLRKIAKPVEENYPGLKQLVDNMFETMYAANGVGLAAPQVGLSIRLFVTDSAAYNEDDTPDMKVFINPVIESSGDESIEFEEGCLSIPGIREKINRPEKITLRYQDENFKEHLEEFKGIMARVIQHEFDHIEGILFTDKISHLKKAMLRGKLSDISKGDVRVSYKMKFPGIRKK